MITFYDGRSPVGRRELLRIGTLGLGGLSLPSLLAARETPDALTGRSVIFLFQQGGPSQLEAFDPKPDAPSGNGTVGDTVQTTIPGVHFGAAMSRLARLAHKLVVVRSFQTNNSGHNIRPIVGKDSLEANIGTHYSRVAGMTRPLTGMPTNAVLFPQAVDPEVTKGSARGNLTATGPHGAAYAPFVPGARGKLQEDMKLSVPRERFLEDRRALLSELDKLSRAADASGQVQATDDMQERACQLLLGGGVSKALDLSKEDARTLARYDTSRFARKGQWDRAKRGKRGYYTGQAATIGKLLLLARRLCEAGCGFVTVHASYAGVWDMHADGNNLNMADGMEAVGRSFDHAVAAFIEDVEARGLKDKIMLVCTGEMGRTPRLNKRGGRDHWARLAPLLLYGGGIDGGRVIGQSDRQGGEPATDNLTPKHLISTILRRMIDPGKLRLVPGIPQEINRLMEAPPIPGLA